MSLISGPIPIMLEILVFALLVAAVGRRARPWLIRWFTIALLTGVILAQTVRLFVGHQGWSAHDASVPTVLWVLVSGFAAATVPLIWRGSTWWRRSAALFAVPLALVCAVAELNIATGYLPTVQSAWQRITGTQPPQWIDESALAAMRERHDQPTRGTVVRIRTPSDSSGFDHRTELVYLPPAWFRSDPAPALPTVMAIGAEFSHPSDWPESGGAVATLDAFAALHHGYTPVVVFPDSTGAFDNDTECVNGPRGNAADHLTKDVVPYVTSRFGTLPGADHRGLVGWSSGGTCALMLAVRNPNLFSAFVSLDGQLGPNAGTTPQTIARLFGGDTAQWASFDPQTIITEHGRYSNMAGWLGVSEPTATVHRAAGDEPVDPAAIAGWDRYSEDHAGNANRLCALLSAHHVECAVVSYPGSHSFTSAGSGFAAALPWLASRLATPYAGSRPMPGG